MIPVACAGDTETFAACSDTHPGGTYTLTAGGLNLTLKVRGRLAIVRGQTWQAHCTATAGTASPPHPVLKVRGLPVCLRGDKSTSGCHASAGIVTKQTILSAKS